MITSSNWPIKTAEIRSTLTGLATNGYCCSETMLTINSDTHPVTCNYHRPGDEKRMIVILGEEDYDAWLDAPAARLMDFMRQCPPEDLVAVGEPA